jgi:hypothetical protein
MNHTQYFKLNDVINDLRTGSIVKMTLYLPFGTLQTFVSF